ncbi:mechanosensitive ion channel family protein [Jannaschia rubra]|uniref:Small-conductance mechanosensitive channel n=1 Tax=Jannaschia rubra TaxID=282197 RepID=A0A0M6XQ67_9RHOB|nr:mechanosensitive ion channel family protein [Jannaschia rubra]CTQ33038.1 Small-conductance mechanosensitive channel [Jannaschia rubra]SFG58121.1 Mechanosensitive ion channel [Jannaschia rubra]
MPRTARRDRLWSLIRGLFLALAIAFTLPVAAQETPTQPSGAISTAQDGTEDAAIERRIDGIIGELDEYEGVSVDVREGIVTFGGEVLDGETIPELDALASRVDGVVAVRNTVVENTDVARRLDPIVERTKMRFVQFVNYLPLIVVAMLAGGLVMLVGVLLARWERPWGSLAPNAFIAEIYRVILRLVFVVAGIVTALDILNATAVLTGLFGAAGILGLAVGFAVQDTVENFIASIMLSVRQPFRPNDMVDIEGSVGTVIRLTSRATILLDPDGNHVRLPNSFVFKAKIINYTRNTTRRFGFELGIDPNDDLAEARRIGIETLAGLAFVLADPPPQVWIKDSGDSTITMEFFAWLNQREAAFLPARGEALRVVMAALTQAGIGLPEPSYRLNLSGGALPVVDLPDKENRAKAITLTEMDAEPAPKPKPTPEPVMPDRTIERMADQERASEGEEDLLSHGAPQE